MLNSELDPKYKLLFDAAVEVLQRNYHPVRHSVGAAVLTASGNIYAGVNVESSGHGVCAEPIALGSALSREERDFSAVVAVCRRGADYRVLSPCGNCRQMLLDYAPEIDVIYTESNGVEAVAKAKYLLPGAYISPDLNDPDLKCR